MLQVSEIIWFVDFGRRAKEGEEPEKGSFSYRKNDDVYIQSGKPSSDFPQEILAVNQTR